MHTPVRVTYGTFLNPIPDHLLGKHQFVVYRRTDEDVAGFATHDEAQAFIASRPASPVDGEGVDPWKKAEDALDRAAATSGDDRESLIRLAGSWVALAKARGIA